MSLGRASSAVGTATMTVVLKRSRMAGRSRLNPSSWPGECAVSVDEDVAEPATESETESECESESVAVTVAESVPVPVPVTGQAPIATRPSGPGAWLLPGWVPR